MRKGAQEPRVRVENGEVCESDGTDAANLMANMGMTLFPWQADILDVWCSRDSRDTPSFVTCGLSVPRQNGKNAILEAFEFYQLAICGAHILHTAHRVKTAKKSFQRLVRYFTDKKHRDVMRAVEKIRYTNGEESIQLKNGGVIEFSARSRAGARGFDDIQVVVFDEAQDLTDDQLSAIMYTLAASATGYRQMIYTGTPPDIASPGTVFRRTRKNALDGGGKRLCWHEWSVESAPKQGATFADVLDDVYAANPSMGYTLDEEYTESEFGTAGLESFACERLGWWKSDVLEQNLIIDAKRWAKCCIDPKAAPKEGKLAYGVKFTPDGKTVAVSAAILPAEGKPFVELVDVYSTGRGVGFLTEWLMERKSKCAVCVIDGRAGAQALMQQLRAGGFPRKGVVECTTSNAIAAASGFLDAVNGEALEHIASPAMDDSALKSVKRVIGRNGAFGFGDGLESLSAPIESGALALWGVKNTRRDPKRKAKVHV